MSEGDPGPGVDAMGRQVVDPTTNVLSLVDAAVKRQDDLRNAEARHVREIANLRAAFDEKLSNAESARIDAIRKVDVDASSRAAEQAATVANTLAAQVSTAAEAMRAQVSATAQAAVIAQDAALAPIKTAIEELRQAQYEAQGGKQTVSEGRDDRRGGSMLVVAIISAVIAFVGMMTAMAAIIVVILLATN